MLETSAFKLLMVANFRFNSFDNTKLPNYKNDSINIQIIFPRQIILTIVTDLREKDKWEDKPSQCQSIKQEHEEKQP